MGRKNGQYHADFPKGTLVKIKPLQFLQEFQTAWRLRNPLNDEQLDFAGKTANVESVGFYHGGDELYTLDSVPGIWHEACLELP